MATLDETAAKHGDALKKQMGLIAKTMPAGPKRNNRLASAARNTYERVDSESYSGGEALSAADKQTLLAKLDAHLGITDGFTKLFGTAALAFERELRALVTKLARGL